MPRRRPAATAAAKEWVRAHPQVRHLSRLEHRPAEGGALPVIAIGISWRLHDGMAQPRPRAYHARLRIWLQTSRSGTVEAARPPASAKESRCPTRWSTSSRAS
jgi:hypothetical protein